MRLLKLQLCGVFNCDDALVLRDTAGKDVQHRGLTRTRPAGYQHVQFRFHNAAQHLRNLFAKRTKPDQIFHLQKIYAEAANRHYRPIKRERWNDCIDARTVLQASINHG